MSNLTSDDVRRLREGGYHEIANIAEKYVRRREQRQRHWRWLLVKRFSWLELLIILALASVGRALFGLL